MPVRSRVYGAYDVTATPSPISGIYRIYADGTAGSDANDGSSWTNAVQTAAMAEEKIRNTLLAQPTNIQLILYLRGAFTDAFIINMPMIGQSRLHIVHPVFESVGGAAVWTNIVNGNVIAVAAPGYFHGNVQLELSDTTGVLVGQFIRLRNAAGTIDMLFQVLRVWDSGAQHFVIISCPDTGSLPSWVDATATYEVYYPSMTCPSFAVQGSLTRLEAVAPEYNQKNVVFGISANVMEITGSHIAVGGCVAPQFRFKNVNAGAGTWYLDDTDDGPWLTWQLMEEFGLGNWYNHLGFDAPVQYVGNRLGDAQFSGNVSSLNTASAYRPSMASGVFDGNILCDTCGMYILVSRLGSFVRSAGEGYVQIAKSLVGLGLTSAATFTCEDRSTMSIGSITYDVGVGEGASTWMVSCAGGNVFASSFDYYPVAAPGQLSPGGFYASAGGTITVNGTVAATIPVTARLALAEPGSSIKFTGASVTIPTYTGAYPSMSVDGGTITVDGNLVKSGLDTIAASVITVTDRGRFSQADAKALTLPASANTYLVDYGATGAFWVHDGSFCRFGSLAGGSTGGATALYLKRGSHLTYKACALGDGTGTAAVVGGNAAAPWAPAVDAAAELCSLNTSATP